MGIAMPRQGKAADGPFISALIPTFNNERTIVPLLDSLLRQSVQADEIIVADDCSSDRTAALAEAHPVKPKVVRLSPNAGPSVARNAGVHATADEPGCVVLFLDSDVVIPPDVVERVKTIFCDAEVSAVNGIMAPPPLNPAPATWYKCLVECAWGANVPQWDTSATCFNTRIGALRREHFLALGGFDPRYRKPCVEDHEFGQRYSAAHAILHDQQLRAQHHFSGFKSTLKNYWKRTSDLLELLWSTPNARTDKGGASASSAMEYALGAGCWACFLGIPLAGLLPFSACLLAFLAVSWKSLRQCLAHKGPVFFLYAALLHSIYGMSVTLAGVWFLAKRTAGRGAKQ